MRVLASAGVVLVVEELLGVDAHVVGVGEALVADGGAELVVGDGGGAVDWGEVRGAGWRGGAGEAAGGGEEVFEKGGPGGEGSAEIGLLGGVACEGLLAVVECCGEFGFQVTEDADGGGVGEWVGFGEVLVDGAEEGGEGMVVDAGEEFGGGGGVEDFVEEGLQVRVGDFVEAERGVAHFGDAVADGVDVLGAEVGVVGERHFEFVVGFGGEAGVEDGEQALECVVVAFQANDVVVDGEAGFLCCCESGEAGEWR